MTKGNTAITGTFVHLNAGSSQLGPRASGEKARNEGVPPLSGHVILFPPEKKKKTQLKSKALLCLVHNFLFPLMVNKAADSQSPEPGA